jgi:hypothetical protein
LEGIEHCNRSVGAIGSASASRAEGWEFDSLTLQLFFNIYLT